MAWTEDIYGNPLWQDDYGGDTSANGSWDKAQPQYGGDTSANGSWDTPPAGATQKDAQGNWYDGLGNLIQQAAIPLLGTLATPWLNNLQSGGLQDKAIEMLKGGGNVIAGVNSPNLQALIPQLSLQVMQGLMTPAEAQAALQEASGMNNVNTDAASLQGQRDALSRLSQIGTDGGMTDADRAALAQTMNQTSAKTAQDRAAQIQQMQMQGNAGTGTELAARLSGVQSGANANAMAGAQTAQSAQARALAAIQAGMQGNSALNTSQFDQQARKAQAQDAVNNFNATARNSMNLANQGAQQAANMANFNTRNTIEGTNTGIRNQQATMPLQVANQQFANDMTRATNASKAQIGAGSAIAKMAGEQMARSGNAAATAPAATTGSSGSNTANTIGKVVDIGSKLWGMFSDERMKTDKRELQDDDVDTMMAKLTGYKYRYRGNDQEQHGVMAQDMEHGMKDSVIDTPAGKVIQRPDALSNALAVLANQHDRIKKLEGK